MIRAYLTEETADHFRDLMRFCADERLAYHLVSAEEMERITESMHHEGVCLLIRKRAVLEPEEWLAKEAGRRPSCVLGLEEVSNPHNVGAMMRTCAHFGVHALLATDPAVLQTGAALRTSQGGGEYITPLDASPWRASLQAFHRAGYAVIATSSSKGRSLFETALPDRCLFLLGEEQGGLSQTSFQEADLLLSIPGSAWVESLNVASALAILLAEWWRQTYAPRPPRSR